MPHRIVVASDLRITRKGIVTMLAHDSQLQVLGEAENGPQAVTACYELQPDLLILALRMPPLAAADVTRLLAADPCAPRVLVLDDISDDAAVHAVLTAGATGLLPATVGDAELCAAVHRVLAGELVLPNLAGPSESHLLLGPRERLILSKVAEGLPNKTIAQQHGISVRTVGNHLQHIYQKLGVSNRMEAVIRARQEGLLRNG